MRAIQFTEYGGPEVLHAVDIDMPAAGPGMICLRVRAVGVNPADFKWRRGMFQSIAPLRFPHILGYDIAGTVASLGAGVTGIQIGDRMVAMLSPIEKGGYAEYAVLPAVQAVPIPSEMDFATAAALPTAGLTGVQLVEDFIQPTAGQTVLITGAVGAVGRFAMFAARRLGARVIVAVRASQMEEARALGAVDVIVLGAQDWAGASFDHVADTIGGPAVTKLCRHVASGGRIRTVATDPLAPEGLPSQPVFIAVRNDPARLLELVRTVAAGTLPVPIARRLPLEAASEAHRLIEAGGMRGKIILEP